MVRHPILKSAKILQCTDNFYFILHIRLSLPDPYLPGHSYLKSYYNQRYVRKYLSNSYRTENYLAHYWFLLPLCLTLK